MFNVNASDESEDQTQPPQINAPDSSMREAAEAASQRALDRAKAAKVPEHFEPPTLDETALKSAREAADSARQRGIAEYERMVSEKAREQAAEMGAMSPIEDPPVIEGLVVVAISSGMPQQMVADYMQQLDGHRDAVLVLRGFVGGATAVKPTGQFIEKASRMNPSTHEGGHYVVKTLVDPLLFRQLGIDRVPAVAYLHGVQEIGHCDEEDFNAAVVVYGGARVDAALSKAKANGANIPESVIGNYRPQRWETSQ
jgi:type-F conjugative transfer system pilin assembly protein TrbC